MIPRPGPTCPPGARSSPTSSSRRSTCPAAGHSWSGAATDLIRRLLAAWAVVSRPEAADEPGVGLPPRPRRLTGLAARRPGGVPGVEFRIDRRRHCLVLPDHLDQLGSQERQSDDVTQDPERAAAEYLVGPQAWSPWPGNRVIVRPGDEAVAGDHRQAEDRVADHLGCGDPQ